MGAMWERLLACKEEIRKRTGFVPATAVVLGSGLGDFGDLVKTEAAVPYGELPGFPSSTVAGHRGRFLFGYVGKEPVAVMQGRVHYYEGYPMEEVVLPLRVLGLLGCRRVLLTNAAGGIGTEKGDLAPGDLMLLLDHIASLVPSPLRGQNEEKLGPRFPDMSAVYSPRLRALAKEAAGRLEIPLKEGVYLQAPGPQYETPAEIRAFAALGANAVGMSTACEAIAARHMGMEVLGISCITNLAAGLQKAPLSHEEVKKTAAEASRRFCALLEGVLLALGEEE